MTEADLQAEIRLAVGRYPHARLFRNNVLDAWQGVILARDKHAITLGRYRYVSAGLTPGSADLIGLTTITVTPEMVGKRVAVFTSGECKRPDAPATLPPAQQNWLEFVRGAGGFAGVLRSVDDALRLVRAA